MEIEDSDCLLIFAASLFVIILTLLYQGLISGYIHAKTVVNMTISLGIAFFVFFVFVLRFFYNFNKKKKRSKFKKQERAVRR